MEFTPFVATFVRALGLEPPPDPTPETGLFDELGLDSFKAFEMLIFIEATAGLGSPPPYLPEIYTLGDAYEYYRFARELALDPGPSGP